MTDRNTISQVIESLFEDWIEKNKNIHPLAVENMRLLEADALALLKEQEPRVMTLEEVKAFGWDYCYLEAERLHGKEYRMVCGDYALACITWPFVASMRIQYGDNGYGKKWRCWSAKPTDEQRKAVKWLS